MAHPLSIKELGRLPTRHYESIRNELQTGDIVFCSGGYFFSKIIQRFTKSVWSHIGVIYRDESLNRVLILESETLIGVRLAPVSKYIKDYHGKNRPYKGRMVIARVFPDADVSKLKLGISHGIDELTKPYDNWEIGRIAFRKIFGIGKRADDRKYICSELVYEVYRYAEIKFLFNNQLISPDDIWKDERIKMKYRIL
jgi:Permuted papain-like amidase enzyme, YaeF/YiiX, C92 family